MSWKWQVELVDRYHQDPKDTGWRMWVAGRGQQRRKAANGSTWEKA